MFYDLKVNSAMTRLGQNLGNEHWLFFLFPTLIKSVLICYDSLDAGSWLIQLFSTDIYIYNEDSNIESKEKIFQKMLLNDILNAVY